MAWYWIVLLCFLCFTAGWVLGLTGGIFEVLFGFARLFGGEAKAGGKAVGDDHFLVKLLRTLEWIMNKVTAPFFWILKVVDKRNGT